MAKAKSSQPPPTVSAISLEAVAVQAAIIELNGRRVILDSDLAAFYGVETRRLNEQVKRNQKKFQGYAFRLSPEEFDFLKSQIATAKTDQDLKSQNATPKDRRGGRRTPPNVFTEHGVVMAATVLNSDRAVEASKFIVDVFVEVRRQATTGAVALPSPGGDATALGRLTGFSSGFKDRLQTALDHVMDSMINQRTQTTVREEVNDLISESIQHLKDRLQRAGLENTEIAARVTKLLAEAEKEKAMAAKTRAEADRLEFGNLKNKLLLLLKAQQAMEQDSVAGLLEMLESMNND